MYTGRLFLFITGSCINVAVWESAVARGGSVTLYGLLSVWKTRFTLICVRKVFQLHFNCVCGTQLTISKYSDKGERYTVQFY